MTYPNSGTTLPTGSNVGSNVEQATGSSHAFVDRLAQGAHETVDKVAARSGRVGESMKSMRNTLQSQAEHLVEARGEIAETARSYVREKPLTALLAAMLVGVLAASLLRGR